MLASRMARWTSNGRFALVLITAVAALTAGCADGGDGNGDDTAAVDRATGGAGVPTFVADDVEYSDSPDTVPSGSVTFQLINDGNVEHDVVIEELDNQQVVYAAGGETATGQVDLAPGAYTYYCSVAGHRAAGMEGTLTAG